MAWRSDPLGWDATPTLLQTNFADMGLSCVWAVAVARWWKLLLPAGLTNGVASLVSKACRQCSLLGKICCCIFAAGGGPTVVEEAGTTVGRASPACVPVAVVGYVSAGGARVVPGVQSFLASYPEMSATGYPRSPPCHGLG